MTAIARDRIRVVSQYDTLAEHTRRVGRPAPQASAPVRKSTPRVVVIGRSAGEPVRRRTPDDTSPTLTAEESRRPMADPLVRPRGRAGRSAAHRSGIDPV